MNIRRRAKRLRRERLIARGELPKEALDAPLSDDEEAKDQSDEGEVRVNCYDLWVQMSTLSTVVDRLSTSLVSLKS